MILNFIDTETTGLDLVDHDIIDFASLQVDWDKDKNKFNVISQYTTKIKSDNIHLASEQALKINHYKEDFWRNAPNGKEVAGIIKQIIKTSDVIIGQNVVFDYRFINKLFDCKNLQTPKWPKYWDTKHMADQLVLERKLKKSSLDYTCKHFNIKNIGRPHTAMCDVLRTFELFKVLSDQTVITDLDFSNPYDPYKDR
jgi:DNA polymerase III epsilon subunit-like protein